MSCDGLTVYPAIELQQDENDDDDDHAATWIDLDLYRDRSAEDS